MDNTQYSQAEWERENSVRVRICVMMRCGEVMFGFKRHDGKIIYHSDPLPEYEFNKLGHWQIADGEELEIEIRRFPSKWKKE